MKKKILSVVLSAAIAVLAFPGCTVVKAAEDSGQNQSESGHQMESGYQDFITVDVFSPQADMKGMSSEWVPEIVKDKFNMELHFIFQEESQDAAQLVQKFTDGELGDLVILDNRDGAFQEFVEDGTLMEAKSEEPEPARGPYVRWEAYQAAGYPRMSEPEDIPAALQKMQEACPLGNSGEQAYGLSFLQIQEGDMIDYIGQMTAFYGYDRTGFALAGPDGDDFQSIIGEDSMYVQMLRLFYQINQMGLIDPESLTQDSETLIAKYEDGRVLGSPWQIQNMPGIEQGEVESGSNVLVPVNDLRIFLYGSNPDEWTDLVIGIESKAEDPERLADFIAWLGAQREPAEKADEGENAAAGIGDLPELKEECSDCIEDYSWKMIFAPDEEEFDHLLNEMQSRVDKLGYQDFLAADVEKARAARAGLPEEEEITEAEGWTEAMSETGSETEKAEQYRETEGPTEIETEVTTEIITEIVTEITTEVTTEFSGEVTTEIVTEAQE